MMNLAYSDGCQGEEGGGILAIYETGRADDILIAVAWDRSTTTFLLPQER